MCSCVFLAERKPGSVEEEENGFLPISLAREQVNFQKKSVTASLLGIRRRSVYRGGLGCVLLPLEDQKSTEEPEVPQRKRISDPLPYPLGNTAPVKKAFAHVDYTALDRAMEQAFSPEVKTKAVLVLHKNRLLGERYASGYSAESIFPGWSMTKSLTNSILGVLQRQGRLHLEEDHLFSQWENDSRAEISLKDLLQMNSGLEWEESYTKISDVTRMLFLSEDMGRDQLIKNKSQKEQHTWNYSSGTTNLLSRFIRNQFPGRQEYLDFWYRALIDRIGMNSMVVETDLSGIYIGSSYAWATARDWGKFGLLYLNNGNWNGSQILNESWVNFSKKPAPGSDRRYGAHFWLNAGGKYPDVPRDMFSANGFQGQYVFIIPSRDLVIVRLGLKDEPDFNVNKFLKQVLKAV